MRIKWNSAGCGLIKFNYRVWLSMAASDNDVDASVLSDNKELADEESEGLLSEDNEEEQVVDKEVPRRGLQRFLWSFFSERECLQLSFLSLKV